MIQFEAHENAPMQLRGICETSSPRAREHRAKLGVRLFVSKPKKKTKTKLVSRRVDYYTVLPFGRCHLLVGTGFKVFIVGSKGRLKNAADQRYGVHLPVKLFTRHKEVEVCGCADI